MRFWEFKSLSGYGPRTQACLVLWQTMRLPHGLAFCTAVAADNVAAHAWPRAGSCHSSCHKTKRPSDVRQLDTLSSYSCTSHKES